ncbi:uncharacterized protein LOC131940976 [Physella acuta]|uniref:uncharacterized protein LOC131940976 n=1 Tax=Physella acuta TaxID=109671 RepID=UPI0027DDF475|nr:uncharacterized protein LOC131940976 [Physella acuta]
MGTETSDGYILTPTFGKYVLVICGTLNFGLAIAVPMSMSVMFLEWHDSFQVSRARTAAVHSTCIGIIFGAGVIAGYLMNKIGARLTCMVGSFLATSGLLISCFATSITYMTVSTGVITGFGFCLVQLPCIPSITPPFTKYRSLCISICTFGAATFNMVFPYFYRWLINQYSWRGAFFILSGLTLQTFVYGLAMTSTIKRRKLVGSTNQEACTMNLLEEKVETCDNHVTVGDEGHPVDGDLELHHLSSSSDLEYKQKNGNSSLSDCKQNGDNPSNSYPPLLSDSHHKRDTEEEYCEANPSSSENPNERSCDELKNNTTKMRCLLYLDELKSSKWRFMIDPVFLLFLAFLGVTLSSILACYVLLMDLATNIGFSESTGVLFILITAVSNLCGRIVSGLMNLAPRLHSFVIICLFGGLASLAMAMLGVVTDFGLIVACLVLLGSGIGALASIYPKCILDLKTVDSDSYPLALGITCTAEGFFDFVIPITIGHLVDISGYYFLPLVGLASLSMFMTLVLFTAFCMSPHRKNPIKE